MHVLRNFHFYFYFLTIERENILYASSSGLSYYLYKSSCELRSITKIVIQLYDFIIVTVLCE